LQEVFRKTGLKYGRFYYLIEAKLQLKSYAYCYPGSTMGDQLKTETGLPCNPHTFRRTFACLLRNAGVDTMTVKDLGRWESIEMVQRYTRSVTFQAH
jgi:integrase